MKIINFEDIRSLNVPPEICFDWVSEMIDQKQKAFLPAKIHMPMQRNRFCNVMPCFVNESEKANWGE